MGVVKSITHDGFPEQPEIGKPVRVFFHYNTEKPVEGVIVRYDKEEPFVTIFKLSDGRHVLATECAWEPVTVDEDGLSNFTLSRDAAADMTFSGTLLVEELSVKRVSSTSWTVMSAYKTKGGGYVVHSWREEIESEEKYHVRANFYVTVDEMITDLGRSKLTKKLFYRMGIDQTSGPAESIE